MTRDHGVCLVGSGMLHLMNSRLGERTSAEGRRCVCGEKRWRWLVGAWNMCVVVVFGPVGLNQTFLLSQRFPACRKVRPGFFQQGGRLAFPPQGPRPQLRCVFITPQTPISPPRLSPSLPPSPSASPKECCGTRCGWRLRRHGLEFRVFCCAV